MQVDNDLKTSLSRPFDGAVYVYCGSCHKRRGVANIHKTPVSDRYSDLSLISILSFAEVQCTCDVKPGASYLLEVVHRHEAIPMPLQRGAGAVAAEALAEGPFVDDGLVGVVVAVYVVE